MILAGEPAGPLGGRTSLLSQASVLVAGGGSLKRMTILAAHADAAVVVQADYYSPDEASPPAVSLPAVSLPAVSLPAVSLPAIEQRPARSTHWNPIRLYQRTQSNLGGRPLPALLDVLA